VVDRGRPSLGQTPISSLDPMQGITRVQQLRLAALALSVTSLLLFAGLQSGSAATSLATIHQAVTHKSCPPLATQTKLGGYIPRFSIQVKDATGCDAYAYGIAEPVPSGFFGGANFRPGQLAYEWGSLETTELTQGRQTISVTNPSASWLAAYEGSDICTPSRLSTGQVKVTCSSDAVEQITASWVWLIAVFAVLAALLAFIIHATRPAGPVRRKKHFRRRQAGLATLANNGHPLALSNHDLRSLRRRIRRLERALDQRLSESQRRWFAHHLSTGRHGAALETLARWVAESNAPLPHHLREEFDWLSSSLEIRQLVLPILDTVAAREEAYPEPHHKSRSSISAFEVSAKEFGAMVAEVLDTLPEEFARAMDNVAITVEDVASDEVAKGQTILGVYIGVPLTLRRHWQWNVHPDKIIIFRATICDCCTSEEEVRALVYRVVIHEVAHHFGIGDAVLSDLGW
jgi:predicted Zn-dependent protease with MMP-like domain